MTVRSTAASIVIPAANPESRVRPFNLLDDDKHVMASLDPRLASAISTIISRRNSCYETRIDVPANSFFNNIKNRGAALANGDDSDIDGQKFWISKDEDGRVSVILEPSFAIRLVSWILDTTGNVKPTRPMLSFGHLLKNGGNRPQTSE